TARILVRPAHGRRPGRLVRRHPSALGTPSQRRSERACVPQPWHTGDGPGGGGEGNTPPPCPPYEAGCPASQDQLPLTYGTIRSVRGIHLTGVAWTGGAASSRCALPEVNGRVPGLVPHRRGLPGLPGVAALARAVSSARAADTARAGGLVMAASNALGADRGP